MHLAPSRALLLLIGAVVLAAAAVVASGGGALPSAAVASRTAPTDPPDLGAVLAAAVDDGRVEVTLTLESADDPARQVGPAVIATAVLAGTSVAVDLDVGGVVPDAGLASSGYLLTPAGVAFRAAHLFGDDEFHLVRGDEAAAIGAAEDLRSMASFDAVVRDGVVALADHDWAYDGPMFEQSSTTTWAAVVGRGSAAGAVLGGLLAPDDEGVVTIRVAADASTVGWTMRAEVDVAGQRLAVTVRVEVDSIGAGNVVVLPATAPGSSGDLDRGSDALLPTG